MRWTERQRAMLREMGIRLWWPEEAHAGVVEAAAAPDPVLETAGASASPVATRANAERRVRTEQRGRGSAAEREHATRRDGVERGAKRCAAGAAVRAVRAGRVERQQIEREQHGATLGAGAKANHLAYLGDTTVGERVNFGAGSITANYDGANKHRTTIGADAHIGSNCVLVAPVTIGAGATIGGGSTIAKEAPAGELTVARARQTTLPGWKRPVKS
jgi:hypothetical protein